MYDSPTNLDYLDVLSSKKKILLHKTCSAFPIPPKGVVLFFDLYNYPNSPDHSVWRNLRFHENIEQESAPVPIPLQLQQEINGILYSKNYYFRKIDSIDNLCIKLKS